MPYSVEKITRRKWCTRLILDPPTGHPGWELYLDERVVLKKKWVEPDYYLHAQEMEAMKRDAAAQQKTAGKYKHCGDKFFKDLATVEEYLGDCWWDDGKPRTPCHLKVEVVGDMIHIALIDTENRRSCHTAARGLVEALTLLESHCVSGTPPWRSWGPERGRRN